MTRPLFASLLALLVVPGCAFQDADSGYDPRHPPTSYDAAGEPPDRSEGDRYEGVGTNPFVMTAHDPFSTFAADVDTASYDIFVRDALRGVLPSPDSVRLEDYVNAFDYDYPAPPLDAEVPFSIDLAAAGHPFRSGIAQLRVGIQAAVPPEHVKVPTNLVFLIDTSGSMQSAEKLPLVQRVILDALPQLGEHDTVAIVTYAGSTEVRLPPTSVAERSRIEGVVTGLAANGSTNGASGIELAYAQAEAGFIEGGFNHVILCTDGDFNVGITSTEALVELIEEKRRSGVTLTALGFGYGNLNDAMMERISNSGNGVYSVIVSEAHATRYAEEDLLRTAHFVAQDMKIQLELNPEHVLAYRLLGYENRAIADDDFREDAVDAGEVGAGYRVTALYELVLVGQSVPLLEGAPELDDGEPVEGERAIPAEELVRVRVRWKDIGASESDAAYETAAGLTPSDVLASTDDPDFLWASAMAAFAEILKQNAYGDSSHLARIAEIFAAQAERDEDRAELAQLFDAVRSQL